MDKKLSPTALQRVEYFLVGCNQDGIEIETQEQLQDAFEFVCMAIRKDLGGSAQEYIEAFVVPRFRQVAMSLIKEA